jgi:hypothetical protein
LYPSLDSTKAKAGPGEYEARWRWGAGCFQIIEGATMRFKEALRAGFWCLPPAIT